MRRYRNPKAQAPQPALPKLKQFDLDAFARDIVIEREHLTFLSWDSIIENGADYSRDEAEEQTRNHIDYMCNPDGSYFTGILYETDRYGNMDYYRLYKDGLKDGPDVEFYPSGAVKNYCVWHHLAIVNYYAWYESGRISGYAFTDPAGVWKSYRWYESGRILGYAIQDRNTHKSYEWYESGRLMRYTFHNHSTDNKETFVWYENGKLKEYDCRERSGYQIQYTRYDVAGNITEDIRRP